MPAGYRAREPRDGVPVPTGLLIPSICGKERDQRGSCASWLQVPKRAEAQGDYCHVLRRLHQLPRSRGPCASWLQDPGTARRGTSTHRVTDPKHLRERERPTGILCQLATGPDGPRDGAPEPNGLLIPNICGKEERPTGILCHLATGPEGK